MCFYQALMKIFRNDDTAWKNASFNFWKITLSASTWSFESYPSSIYFWVATPEVKTRNATARAQEKKVSGPGNRIGWPYEAVAWIQRNGATYGGFLKWWYPQNTPKWSFLVGKPMVVGYHHFRKHPYSSWLRDYLVIANCYISFFIWSDSLSSSPITQLNPNKIFPNSNQIHFSPKNPSILCPFELRVPWVVFLFRVVPASWSSRHRSHRWWDWSEPCLLPARFSGSKTRALRLQIDAKVFLTLATLAPNELLESLDTLPMSANKKILEVGNFSTFRFKQKTILSIQLCSVSLETSTLGSMWSPWNWESGRRPNFLLLFLILFILPDLHSFQKQASVVTS